MKYKAKIYVEPHMCIYSLAYVKNISGTIYKRLMTDISPFGERNGAPRGMGRRFTFYYLFVLEFCNT